MRGKKYVAYMLKDGLADKVEVFCSPIRVTQYFPTLGKGGDPAF